MFGGSSRRGAAALQLVRATLFGKSGTADLHRRLHAMTGSLPADQGRAPHLYDEQLQRQQQEKMLMKGREARADLMEPPLR